MDGFEGALWVGIEKIVFAKCRDAGLDGFGATEHASGIEVFRAKYLSGAVNPSEPGQKREIFPYGAQQNLVKMGVGIHQARHQDAAGCVDDFFAIADLLRRAFAYFGYKAVFYAHIAVE